MLLRRTHCRPYPLFLSVSLSNVYTSTPSILPFPSINNSGSLFHSRLRWFSASPPPSHSDDSPIDLSLLSSLRSQFRSASHVRRVMSRLSDVDVSRVTKSDLEVLIREEGARDEDSEANGAELDEKYGDSYVGDPDLRPTQEDTVSLYIHGRPNELKDSENAVATHALSNIRNLVSPMEMHPEEQKAFTFGRTAGIPRSRIPMTDADIKDSFDASVKVPILISSGTEIDHLALREKLTDRTVPADEIDTFDPLGSSKPGIPPMVPYLAPWERDIQESKKSPNERDVEVQRIRDEDEERVLRGEMTEIEFFVKHEEPQLRRKFQYQFHFGDEVGSRYERLHMASNVMKGHNAGGTVDKTIEWTWTPKMKKKPSIQPPTMKTIAIEMQKEGKEPTTAATQTADESKGWPGFDPSLIESDQTRSIRMSHGLTQYQLSRIVFRDKLADARRVYVEEMITARQLKRRIEATKKATELSNAKYYEKLKSVRSAEKSAFYLASLANFEVDRLRRRMYFRQNRETFAEKLRAKQVDQLKAVMEEQKLKWITRAEQITEEMFIREVPKDMVGKLGMRGFWPQMPATINYNRISEERNKILGVGLMGHTGHTAKAVEEEQSEEREQREDFVEDSASERGVDPIEADGVDESTDMSVDEKRSFGSGMEKLKARLRFLQAATPPKRNLVH